MKAERFSDWLARYVFAFVLVPWWLWGIFIMSIILFSLPINGYVGGFIDAFMLMFILISALFIDNECRIFAKKKRVDAPIS